MVKTSVQWIISARWILPIVPAEVFEDHSIIVDNEGVIVDVLPTSEVADKYETDAEHHVVLSEHALLPGLFNMHTHSSMTLFRSIIDDVNLQDWLENYIWPAEKIWVSPEFVRIGVEKACVEMIRSGTTCFNDMYFYPEVTADVADKCGLRAAVGVPFMNLPTKWCETVDQQFVEFEKLHEQYKGHPRIQAVLAPHSPYTTDDVSFERVAKLSAEKNSLVHLHLHETAKEVEVERQIQRLAKFGIMNEKLLAVHMTQLDDSEIKYIAEQRVNVVHCPESNLKLGAGMCPVSDLKSIVNLCIGTDGASSNDDLDLFGEVRTGLLVDNFRTQSTKGSLDSSLSAQEWLRTATLNGAKALRIDHLVGSLEKGKMADIVAVHVKSQPVYNVAITLVTNGTNKVTDVWVAGKELLRNDKVIVFDEELVSKNACDLGAKIKSTLPTKSQNNKQ